MQCKHHLQSGPYVESYGTKSFGLVSCVTISFSAEEIQDTIQLTLEIQRPGGAQAGAGAEAGNPATCANSTVAKDPSAMGAASRGGR